MWSSNFAASGRGASAALARAVGLTFGLTIGLVFGLGSCGSKPVRAPATAGTPASAPPPALPVAAPRRPDPPPPSPPIAATALVYEQARIVATIDLAEARALGLEGALRKLAPFRAGAITAATLADASWLVVATPTILPNPRSSFVFRAGPSASSLRQAIESAIAADPQVRVDARGAVLAAHAPIDGSPHVVVVRDDGIVAVIPESEVDRVAPRLAGAKIAVDLEGDAGRATVLRPETMLAEIPESAFAARVRVARAPGTATLHVVAELDCPIEQEAIVGAHAITRAFEKSAAWAGRAHAVARGSVIAIDADATPAMIDAIFR